MQILWPTEERVYSDCCINYTMNSKGIMEFIGVAVNFFYGYHISYTAMANSNGGMVI